MQTNLLFCVRCKNTFETSDARQLNTCDKCGNETIRVKRARCRCGSIMIVRFDSRGTVTCPKCGLKGIVN